MGTDIFTKRKRVPDKFRILLIVFAGLTLIVGLSYAAMSWWQRPIVIARISEFSLNTELEKIDPRENAEDLELSARLPVVYGSLNIEIENIGQRSAENIALNFLPRRCKLGKLYINKTDPKCVVEVSPPRDLRSNPDLWPESIESQPVRRYISIRNLRPGSEIQIRYTIYRESEQAPSFKFGKISSSNAEVKAFYDRR